MTLQPFSGNHLMTLMAIKGLGPTLGAIYTPLLQWSQVRILTHSENLCFTLTNLSVGAPA
ncbi:hypothetical protein A2U01_0109382, partial [Trifolium medium]|nr:hypothetical protein [Trifolium medium]